MTEMQPIGDGEVLAWFGAAARTPRCKKLLERLVASPRYRRARGGQRERDNLVFAVVVTGPDDGPPQLSYYCAYCAELVLWRRKPGQPTRMEQLGPAPRYCSKRCAKAARAFVVGPRRR
jgi:hypothetical protein